MAEIAFENGVNNDTVYDSRIESKTRGEVISLLMEEIISSEMCDNENTVSFSKT